MTVYDFAEMLAKGQRAESLLDEYFTARFDITQATREEQRQGIDRHFTNRQTGYRFTVDYKADWTASRTGKCFIETVSVDTTHKTKMGWALNSRAGRIIYYIPLDGLAYVLKTSTLMRLLPRWISQYPTKKVANQNYKTHGVVVPLWELEAHAEVALSDVPCMREESE